MLVGASDALRVMLEAASLPSCTLLVLTDAADSFISLLQVKEVGCSWSVWRVFGVVNTSLPHLLTSIKQVRRSSWSVTVVVASHDTTFLSSVAVEARRVRLLVWETQVVVVSSLPQPQVEALLQRHWTFSMMNTVLINLRQAQGGVRWEACSNQPYSSEGPKVSCRLLWSSITSFDNTSVSVFQEKYANFHGARIVVTAQILPPFWKIVSVDAGDRSPRYTGRDYLMMHSVATALNFTFHVRRCSSIDEVMEKLEDGTAQISGFRVMLIPQILARVDHTYFIERSTYTFSMAKPTAKPRWQNIYHPLSGQVWTTMIVALLLVPGFLYMIVYVSGDQVVRRNLDPCSMTLSVVSILLGQDAGMVFPNVVSARLLLALWLVLAFILGTAYRGTLTAFLTVPAYPSRPETIDELAGTGVRCKFTSNATQFVKYFQESKLQSYQSVGSRADVVETVLAGLQAITKTRVAFFHERYNMELYIAEYFTRPDGSTPIYVAKENVIPNYAAYMTPHDAPYKHSLDYWLLRIIESGLKNKFSDDMQRGTWQEIRQRKAQLEQQQQQQQLENSNIMDSEDSLQALGLTHMQGSFWMLLLGLLLASTSFLIEVLVRGPLHSPSL
nr:ionotropic receptor 21a-like [Cherax quadricarinatus]